MTGAQPQGNYAQIRVDRGTGRRLAVVAYPPEPPVSDDPQPPATTAAMPKPKRRSAFRHAIGGLALLVSIGLSMWLLERRGWTKFGEWWRHTRWTLSDRSSALRDRVRPGMTPSEVHQRIGAGQRTFWTRSEFFEDYPEYGARIVYYQWWNQGMVQEVAWVETLPESGHSSLRDR